MDLCLSILPAPQQTIFPELRDTPTHFVLYGGTAIALRLGHRESIDFDFFSQQAFDPDKLYKQIPYLKNADIIQKEENTLTCLVDRNGAVKLSFFGDLSLDYVCDPDFIKEAGIKIASLIDLAGMKMAVIQKRATLKDYIDIEAIITKTPIDLITALAAGRIIYGQQFNPYISLKALTYFEGGDLKALSPTLKKNLIGAAKAVQIEQMETRMEALKKLRNRTAAC